MTDPITNAAATAAPSRSGATGAASSSSSASAQTDYDDFLTLLTAQLRNQDPLNPQDSTQFVEQIATFTGVEQQTATNAKLDQLIALQTGDELSALASWIGRTVEADALGHRYNGAPLEVDVPPDGDAETASVVIRDEAGREVATLPADPSGGSVTWDGTRSNGERAPNGVYQVEFVYGAANAGSWSRKGSGSGEVVEARIEGGVGRLVLDTGVMVSADAVTAIRTGA